jgi:hypothetical protein
MIGFLPSAKGENKTLTSLSPIADFLFLSPIADFVTMSSNADI